MCSKTLSLTPNGLLPPARCQWQAIYGLFQFNSSFITQCVIFDNLLCTSEPNRLLTFRQTGRVAVHRRCGFFWLAKILSDTNEILEMVTDQFLAQLTRIISEPFSVHTHPETQMQCSSPPHLSIVRGKVTLNYSFFFHNKFSSFLERGSVEFLLEPNRSFLNTAHQQYFKFQVIYCGCLGIYASYGGSRPLNRMQMDLVMQTSLLLQLQAHQATCTSEFSFFWQHTLSLTPTQSNKGAFFFFQQLCEQSHLIS